MPQSLLPFIVSTLNGVLILHLLLPPKTLTGALKIGLGFGLGLGLSAYVTFLSFILFNHLRVGFVQGLHMGLLILLFLWGVRRLYRHAPPKVSLRSLPYKEALGLGLLTVAAIPLWQQAQFYPFGGWDAWSTWNLKAKFLFLAGSKWQHMLSPSLWRSSPHYPLLLPLINVWGWSFHPTPLETTPLLTACGFTLMTGWILLSGVKKYTGTFWGLLPALFWMSNPFLQKLAFSQYADNVLAYYLLAGVICLFLARKTETSPLLAGLAGSFLGMASFVKSEGVVAAALFFLLGTLDLWLNLSTDKRKAAITAFWIGAGLAALPTVYFKLVYSPGNQTLINGLTSIEAPSTIKRLKITLGFALVEMFSLGWNLVCFLYPQRGLDYLEMKWSGIWVFLVVLALWTHKRSFQRDLWMIPMFFGLYGGICVFYYYFNTYFPIEWWLQVTLSRVLSAVLPLGLFWACSVIQPPRNP